MQDRVVAFYSGGSDHVGRTLERLLASSDEELESVHDYIQWMFPTVQPSGVNRFAPLVTRETVGAFAGNPQLRARLRRAFDRMLSFYGLRATANATTGIRVEVDTVSFPERARNWLHPGNHNHLRLTRIIESLTTLGLIEEGRALQRCLVNDVYEGPGRGKITRETHGYWMRAVSERD